MDVVEGEVFKTVVEDAEVFPWGRPGWRGLERTRRKEEELRSRTFGHVQWRESGCTWQSRMLKKRTTAEKVHGCGTWRRMVGVTGGEARSTVRWRHPQKETAKSKRSC